MNKFQKINLKFDISNVDISKTIHHKTYSTKQIYNKNIDSVFECLPIVTYKFEKEIETILIDQLPKKILDIEIPDIYIFNIEKSYARVPIIAPHIDVERQCCINLYLCTSGEITSFYEWDSHKKTLHSPEHFRAKENECWLLNSQVPHSVTMAQGKQRIMISFSFMKTPFNIIRELYA
jgi:hypothetical protein